MKRKSDTSRCKARQQPRVETRALSSVHDYANLIHNFITNEKIRALEKAAEEINSKDEQLRKADLAKQDLTKEFQVKEKHWQNQVVQASESYRKRIGELETERKLLQMQLTAQAFHKSKLKDRAQKLVKFLNGLGSDINALRKQQNLDADRMGEYAQQHADFGTNYHAIKTGTLQAIQRFSDFKAKNWTLTHDLMVQMQDLRLQKTYLEQQLNEKVGMLSEERDRRSKLENQVKIPQAEQEKLHRVLQECTSTVLSKLDALRSSGDEKRQNEVILDLMKKCSEDTESLRHLGQALTEGIDGLQGLLETLSSVMKKHFDDSTATETEQPDRTQDLGKRFAGLFESIKAELRSQERFVAEASTLRESITRMEERLKMSDAKITDLNSQVAGYHAQETNSREQIQRLEISNASLQMERISAELTNTSLRQKVQENHDLGLELKTVKAEQADVTSKLTTLTAQIQGIEGEKANLKRILAEKDIELRKARLTASDFGPERTQLQNKAREDLQKLAAELGEQAKSFARKQDGEIFQRRREKEALEKNLTAVKSKLESAEAENQKLKEQAKNESATSRIAALSAESELKNTQIRLLSSGEAAEKEKSERLQHTVIELRAAEQASRTSMKLQNDQVQQVLEEHRQIQLRLDESESARIEVEGRLRKQENDARARSGKHQEEQASLQRNVEEAHSHAEAADSRFEEVSTRLEETGFQLKEAHTRLEEAHSRVQESHIRLTDAQDEIIRQKKELANGGPSADASNSVEVPDQIRSAGHQKLQSSQVYGSAPTCQDLRRLVIADSSTSSTSAKKPRRKVDRNVSERSQLFSNQAPVGASCTNVEPTVAESQQDDEMLFDNIFGSGQRPGTQDTYLFDVHLGVRDLEENGVVERKLRFNHQAQNDLETQSPLEIAPQFSTRDLVAHDGQAQLGIFAQLHRTADDSSSSPLSERNVSSSYRIAAEEESQEFQQRFASAVFAEDLSSLTPVDHTALETQDHVSWSQDGIPTSSFETTRGSRFSTAHTPVRAHHDFVQHSKKRVAVEDTQSQEATPGTRSQRASGLSGKDMDYAQSSSPPFISTQPQSQTRKNYSHKGKGFLLSGATSAIRRDKRWLYQVPADQTTEPNRKIAMKRAATPSLVNGKNQPKKARMTAEPETPAPKGGFQQDHYDGDYAQQNVVSRSKICPKLACIIKVFKDAATFPGRVFALDVIGQSIECIQDTGAN
ncbi:hypothetical protein MBLNU459_g5574t1 [Dothideomycetes sp. NU459]